jgi:hypothetical protein
MYVVTAIGVGIDTNVSVCETYHEAVKRMDGLFEEFDICDRQEMCTDCVKGFSRTAQCDVEVQAHYIKYSPIDNIINKQVNN